MADQRMTVTEDVAGIFSLSDEQLEIVAASSTDEATNAALRSIDEEKALALARAAKGRAAKDRE